jgi:hypothetical protein
MDSSTKMRSPKHFDGLQATLDKLQCSKVSPQWLTENLIQVTPDLQVDKPGPTDDESQHFVIEDFSPEELGQSFIEECCPWDWRCVAANPDGVANRIRDFPCCVLCNKWHEAMNCARWFRDAFQDSLLPSDRQWEYM